MKAHGRGSQQEADTLTAHYVCSLPQHDREESKMLFFLRGRNLRKTFPIPWSGAGDNVEFPVPGNTGCTTYPLKPTPLQNDHCFEDYLFV